MGTIMGLEIYIFGKLVCGNHREEELFKYILKFLKHLKFYNILKYNYRKA